MEGTFCFVGMAGFTALTEAHGDQTAADLVDRFSALVEDASRSTAGRLVTTIGDGAFVFAPQPADGVEFVQRLFALATAQANFPALRVGLHHGEALERNGAYFGASVNLAARVTSQARGSQALGTRIIAEAARRHGLSAESIGMFNLRNVRETVELFLLSASGNERGYVIDPVCRMILRPESAAGRLQVGGVDYWFCSLECAGSFARSPQTFIVR